MSSRDQYIRSLDAYIDQANRCICQAALVFDLARAAEKMTDPNCAGGNNESWTNGPYLSSPANYPAIDHSHPYILRTSLEAGVTAGLVYGDNPPRGPGGGVPIPLPKVNGSRVEPYIAKVTIIEQFEILKDFLVELNGPINKKRAQEWATRVEVQPIQEMKAVTDRRNELTHENNPPPPTMREAVEFFYSCRNLAGIFWEAFQKDVLASSEIV